MQLVAWDDPVLRQVCEPVEEVTDAIRRDVREMCVLLRQQKGMALAAPQVGLPIRLIIWQRFKGTSDRPRFTDKFGVAFNPVCEPYGRSVPFNEGCLSFPGLFHEVFRPDRCKMEYTDVTGREGCKLDVGGLTARAFQHECDHLEGKLMIDNEAIMHKWQQMIGGG